MDRERIRAATKRGVRVDMPRDRSFGSTNFVLDSGSQLNMLKFEEVQKLGIKLEDLNTIFLTVNGISGTMADNWYRFRVNLRSTITNMDHFEEFYVSECITENLISYETLKKLGHLDEDQFLEQRFEDKGGPAKAYTSKCEDTTVYVKDTGRYLCACPKRKPLPEGATLEQEQKE